MAETNGLAFDPAQTGCTLPMSPTNRVSGRGLGDGTMATSPVPVRRACGDGETAAASRIFGARAVKVTPNGTIYILERQGSSLRAVDPQTGTIATIAGTTGRGYGGDGGRRLPRCSTRLRKWRSTERRHPDRRHREPCDPRFDPRAGIVMALAGGRKSPGATAARRTEAGLDRPHEQWSARTVRSISVTPTITASGNWCARPEWGGERQPGFPTIYANLVAERCKSTVVDPSSSQKLVPHTQHCLRTTARRREKT